MTDRSERRTGTAENGKPFESVWDYPRPPRLEVVDHLIEVIHGGTTIARSSSCLRVLETSQPPAYYIPAVHVSVEYLRPSTAATACEWKGMAAYADVVVAAAPGNATPGGAAAETAGAAVVGQELVAIDAAWTYPQPTVPFDELQGYWAFYAQRVDCFVDGEKVDPNEGSFYGGWITANITGPFKGAPGTSHW